MHLFQISLFTVYVAAEISSKDKQLSDLKKKFLESQRIEQRLRQERDELHGKAIIMESL